MSATHLIQKIFHLLRQGVTTVFSLDLRSLALLRIGLAIILLIDLTLNFSHLTVHFSDTGILPLDFLLSHHAEENYRTLHTLSDQYRRQFSLFVLNYLILFALLIGWKTRWMHLLAWIFFCGIIGRNPVIISGGDAVMKLLLFRSIFLPTQYRRARDTRHSERPTNNSFLSRATVGLICQMSFIYIFSFALKTNPIWTTHFSATYIALSLDMLRSNRGDIIYQYPTLMQRLTACVYHIEGYAAFLLLMPWKNHRWRAVVISSFIAFHLGLGITMLIGYFPYVCIMGRLALTPTRFRERILPSTGTKKIVSHHRSYLLSSFLIICLVYIALRNLRANNFERREKYFPTTVNKFGFLLRLDQYWSMFSPYPVEDDGWFVIKGTTERGQEVNLLDKGVLVSYDKPKDFSRLYPNEKWRKYFLNMRQKGFDSYRPYYLKWQCRERNKQYPDNKLTRTSMEYVTERTRPDYKVEIEGPTLLSVVDCRDVVK